MFNLSHCPRCHHEIAPERLSGAPPVCDGCGFVISPLETEGLKKYERRSLLTLLSVALLVAGVVMQLISWGEYAPEVVPLKARELVGASDAASSERLAQICLELKKLDCVEAVYVKDADLQPENRVRLAEFQFRRGEFEAVVGSLGPFFASGGQDVDAAYTFARALGETGRIDDAAKYFDYVLAFKPETLQVTVMQTYVRLLVKNERFEEALRAIDRVRKKSQTIANFMDPEYKSIRAKLNPRAT